VLFVKRLSLPAGSSDAIRRERGVELARRGRVHGHLASHLRRDAQHVHSFHFVENDDAAAARRGEEHRLVVRPRFGLEHRPRGDDDRIAIEDAEAERDEADAGAVLAGFVALHEPAARERGEQPVRARLRKPECFADCGHAASPRLRVQVEEDVDGLVDAG
jgi:hypothetical protein